MISSRVVIAVTVKVSVSLSCLWLRLALGFFVRVHVCVGRSEGVTGRVNG